MTDTAPHQTGRKRLISQRYALGEKVLSRREIHQKSNITVFPLFAPGHGAQHADAVGAVSLSQSSHDVPLGMQFVDEHGGQSK